jgi:hypothetical protein
MKKSIALCCLPSAIFSLNQQAPAVEISVQGGNAMIKSQSFFNSSLTSPFICQSGWPPLHGYRSQEYASWPFFLNAAQTL